MQLTYYKEWNQNNYNTFIASLMDFKDIKYLEFNLIKRLFLLNMR